MTDQPYVRRWVRALVLLALAAPLVRATGIMFPFVVPKAFFIQALTALALVLLAGACISDEPPIGMMDILTPRRDPLVWALAIFVVVSALSAMFGASPARGLVGTIERRWGVLTWASFLGFYVLLRLYLDDRFWRLALQAAVAVATAVALYGLLRAGGLWPGQQEAAGWARIESTLGNAGYLGAYLTLSLALTAYLGVRTAGPGWKMLYGCVGLVQLAALLGSGTRAAVVGIAAAMLVLAVVWAFASTEGRVRRGAGATVVALVGAGVVAVAAATGGDPHVSTWWDRVLTALSTETSSARFRLVAWTAALREVAIDPLLGAGPETFEQVWSRQFDPAMYHVSSTPVLDRAHNVLVHVGATTGLLGLVAYMGIWAALGHSLVRAWRRRTLSAAAVSALAFGAIAYFVYLLFWFEDHSSFLLFIVLAGLAGHFGSADGSPDPGVESGGGTDERASGPVSVVARIGVPALLLALAAALAWHNVRVLNAARDAWNGEYAMDAWKGAERYQAALAVGLPGSEPILRGYQRRLAFLASYGDSGSSEGPSPRMEKALAAAERAADRWEVREPENPWVQIRRSRICSLREDVFRDASGKACARRALERAVELSPRRIRYRHWLADHHLAAGNPDRALEVLDDALEVYGSFGETYYYRARVHWASGDTSEAVRQSRTATSLGWGGQPSPFVQELAEWLAEEGYPGDAATMVHDQLGLRYAGLRRPELRTAPGQGFEPWDRVLAGRLPILYLRARDADAAIRVAEFLAYRLPRADRHAERRGRVGRFVDDVRAGRTESWRDSASVIEASVGQESSPGPGTEIGKQGASGSPVAEP